MTSPVLVEFDMRIKIGEREEDDLQLIDGAVSFSDMDPPINMAFTRRLCGEGGAVDINLAHMYEAAEATIQVRISEACGSGLSLQFCRLINKSTFYIISAWVALK